MSQEIKRCPFCGASGEVQKGTIGFWWQCESVSCYHQTPLCKTEEQAIEIWNKIADALAAYDEPEDESEPHACYFCGGPTDILRAGKAYWVACQVDDCAASGPVGDSEQEAIKKYNMEETA